MKKLLFMLAAAVLLCSPTVQADGEDIKALQDQIKALQEKVEALAKAQEQAPKVKKSEPAMALGTQDGLHEFNIRGRVYSDYVNVSDDDNSQDVSATEFRAMRLGVEGKAWEKIKYKAEVDFAGDEVTIKDAYLSFSTKGGSVTLGQFKTPNSLDEQTSSRHISLMERGSFTDAFGLAREMGVAYGANGDNWTAKAGVFKGNSSDNGQGDTTVAGRVTYGGDTGGGKWLVGGSFRSRATDGQFRYRQRPHVHISDRFVNTGRIGNGDDFFYGLEGAFQHGSFHAAAEYAVLDAENAGMGGGDASFSGGYIEAGYFLTGESRSLKLDKGAWDRPKVSSPFHRGGRGAWQVNVRYDVIDLTDDGVFGGEQDTFIIGLNWWPTRHTRMVLNYSHSDIDDAWAVDPVDGSNSVDAFGARFQVDW